MAKEGVTLKEIRHEQVGETLYYERMPNGLDVYVLPKPGFQKTYATFATRYGSIDNHFRVDGGEKIKVPDGIAHFLEHKMFEEPQGDVFSQFASQGASVNAYTSFERTVYLFSATEQIDNNIESLLNFVQKPYFTDENVEKEKGIIAQEINMYKDHPDWQAYFGLIDAFYHVHPVHIDIAGTIESINKITKEHLYECYNTFYHPANMLLFIVGAVDPQKTMLLVYDNQAKKKFPKQGKIERFFDPEPPHIKLEKKVTRLPVAMPKCLFGFKETEVGLTGRQLLERECETKLLLELLFGPSSELYQKLYDQKLINDSFSHEYSSHTGYAFSVIGGDTPDPERLLDTVQKELEMWRKQGIQERDFERIRKKKIGSYMRMLNSLEAIANEFTRHHFRDQDLFDIPEVYQNMTLENIHERFEQHCRWSQMAASIVTNDG